MELVEYTTFLVKNLVKDAEMIKVEALDDENGATLMIMVPEEQMKYVIGKGGKNIKALRTLINTYCYVHKLNYAKINFEAF